MRIPRILTGRYPYSKVSTGFRTREAIENKKRTARRGRLNPDDVAREIMHYIQDREGRWLKKYHFHFLNNKLPFDTYDFHHNGAAEVYSDMLHPTAIIFDRGRKSQQLVAVRSDEQARLAAYLLGESIRGWIHIPYESTECERLLREFRQYNEKRRRRLNDLVEERVRDEEMQEKILRIVTGTVIR